MQLHLYLQLIEQYITHAQIIADSSPAYLRKDRFRRSIEQALKLKQWIGAYRSRTTADAVCRQVVRYQDYLWGILPSPRNNSYHGCLRRLGRITMAAASHLKKCDSSNRVTHELPA